MANLIIKSSADNLVLQGSDASPAITVGATGTTTFAENATFSAGAIGVELEVVPPKVAEIITKKVEIMTLSMGSGSGCDGQYLFANDILGLANSLVFFTLLSDMD